jgi:hypothetical protein
MRSTREAINPISPISLGFVHCNENYSFVLVCLCLALYGFSLGLCGRPATFAKSSKLRRAAVAKEKELALGKALTYASVFYLNFLCLERCCDVHQADVLQLLFGIGEQECKLFLCCSSQ